MLFHLHISSGRLHLRYMIWTSALPFVLFIPFSSSTQSHDLHLFLYHYLVVDPTRHRHEEETNEDDEVEENEKKKGRRKRIRGILTQVVPPAPIAVVIKQRYLQPHLQSLGLSIVLPVSFLQLPFVIVYPQLGVFGIVVMPDISIPNYNECKELNGEIEMIKRRGKRRF